jgi:hypothetical protein
MSYSDFTLPELKKRFQLTTDEATDLFADVEEVPVSMLLQSFSPKTFRWHWLSTPRRRARSSSPRRSSWRFAAPISPPATALTTK